MRYKVRGLDTVEPKVSFACTQCQGRLKAPLTDAGSEHACPQCNVRLVVPGEKELKNWLDERLAMAAQADRLRQAAEVKEFEDLKANEELRVNPHDSQSAPQLSKLDLPTKIRELLHDDEEVRYASRPSKAALVIKMVVYGVVSAGLLIPFVYLSWNNTYYVITDGRTLVMKGIFNVATKILLNRNIQLISINSGIIDRWLNLNSIELATSAQGGGDAGILAFFPGMSKGCVTLRQVEVTAVIKHYAQI